MLRDYEIDAYSANPYYSRPLMCYKEQYVRKLVSSKIRAEDRSILSMSSYYPIDPWGLAPCDQLSFAHLVYHEKCFFHKIISKILKYAHRQLFLYIRDIQKIEVNQVPYFCGTSIDTHLKAYVQN